MRITSRCEDEIDGVALANFEVGLAYEVSSSLGSYLLATGCADLILEDEIAESNDEQKLFRVNVKKWREVAADVTRRSR